MRRLRSVLSPFIKQLFIVAQSLTTICAFFMDAVDMKVRFCDFLPLIGLVVVAYLQGCASNPAEVKAAPVKAVENKEQAAVAAPVVSKEESNSPADTLAIEQPQVRPVVEQPAPPSISPPAEQPQTPKQVEPVPPAPVVRVEPKPAAKPLAKPEPKPVAVATTPAAKPKPVKTPPPEPAPPAPIVAPEPELVETEVVEKEVVEKEVVEKEVEVTMESLPLTIQGEWVLSAMGDTCNLSTVPVRFDDGQGMSKLQLVFASDYWLVKTQSDIDLSYSGTGLRVDEETYFPIEQLVRESDLKFTKDYAAMTRAFMAGKNLRITLGFWPTWPVTETKTIDVPLQHFARAHRAWKQCLSLINGR